MILYMVSKGVISVKSVKKETNCGWREHNNGFVNRSVLPDSQWNWLSGHFFTTDLAEAKKWHKDITMYMSHVIDVAQASLSDVESWGLCDYLDESNIPASRIVF